MNELSSAKQASTLIHQNKLKRSFLVERSQRQFTLKYFTTTFRLVKLILRNIWGIHITALAITGGIRETSKGLYQELGFESLYSQEDGFRNYVSFINYHQKTNQHFIFVI